MSPTDGQPTMLNDFMARCMRMRIYWISALTATFSFFYHLAAKFQRVAILHTCQTDEETNNNSQHINLHSSEHKKTF